MLNRLLIFAGILLLAGAIGTVVWYRTVDSALARVEAEATSRLETAVRRLESQLGQFRRLPRLIADDREIAEFVAAPTPERTPAIDRMLERRADFTGASDIYVMDEAGVTLAASNWRLERTFKGKDFSFRPYFRTAARGGLGVYYALGTTSLKRGFYFSSAVRVDGRIAGVAAVKVDLEGVESGWRGDRDVLYFTDRDGIVFLANREALLLRGTRPIDDVRMAEIRERRRYADREITILPRLAPADVAGHAVIRTDEAPAFWRPLVGAGTWSVQRSMEAPLVDLDAHIIYDASPAFALALSDGLLAGVFTVAGGVVVLLIWQHRVNLTERLRIETRSNEELERKVSERTDALTRANEAMKAEVQERRMAEEELRRTQDDLVQASKLSALGQMSAGISHELNQPLIAIRNFAENARTFLERDRMSDARGNLQQITELSDRMARIIRNLRAFAKKEVDPDATAALDIAVIDALALLETRIRQQGVTIDWQRPDFDVTVRCGAVRLTQVIVNILNNAMDAMQDSPVASREKSISIRVTAGDFIRLSIADSGPGIPEEARGRLFDPFYTTKSTGGGEGLGLGLSISYGIVTGFGGDIRVENAPSGGAVFTIDLVPASAPAPVSESDPAHKVTA